MNDETPRHFLYPAALHASKTPLEVVTVLGSCVSVCLYDTTLRFGGMNHYMLPYWNGSGLATPRYGNIAIKKLVDEMSRMGCSRRHIVAKVFGGADVIHTGGSVFNIGQRNIEVAREMLAESEIPIAAENVGGRNGRKIMFNTATGVVLLKQVPNSQFDGKGADGRPAAAGNHPKTR